MRRLAALALVCSAVTAFALPAEAASRGAGTLTKARRSLSWVGSTFVASEPLPDPAVGRVDMSCHTDGMCDHFALTANLREGARIQISITTPRANPPGTFMGTTSLQPVTGDDFDLYVYDPNGELITGMAGATERGNETVTITHHKMFNGKAYDIAVRAWAVLPGSSYSGTIKALTLGG